MGETPKSRQARMTRTATSPRLAIRILRNIKPSALYLVLCTSITPPTKYKVPSTKYSAQRSKASPLLIRLQGNSPDDGDRISYPPSSPAGKYRSEERRVGK